MNAPQVYTPATLAPPGPDAPVWFQRIRDRLQTAGARLLIDLLMDACGGQLGRAVRASHGWLDLRFRCALLASAPSLDPRDYPTEHAYRRALAELRSAGLVRVVGRGRSVEFWVLAPLRAPAQRELPIAAADPDEARVESRVEEAAEAFGGLRLYTPPENDDVRACGLDARLAVRKESPAPDPAPVSISPAPAPRGATTPDPGAGGWLEEYRRACRAAAAARETAAPAEPAMRQDDPRPLVAHAEGPPPRRPQADPPPAEVKSSPAPAPRQTSTSLKSVSTSKTFTSAPPARGLSAAGDLAASLVQERLPLAAGEQRPPPTLAPPDAAATGLKAIRLVGELRKLDANLDVEPALRITCAVDAGLIPADVVRATLEDAARRKTRAGKRIGNVGAWLMRTWQALVKEADVDKPADGPGLWARLVAPEARTAAVRAAADAGLAWIPRMAKGRKGPPP